MGLHIAFTEGVKRVDLLREGITIQERYRHKDRENEILIEGDCDATIQPGDEVEVFYDWTKLVRLKFIDD